MKPKNKVTAELGCEKNEEHIIVEEGLGYQPIALVEDAAGFGNFCLLAAGLCDGVAAWLKFGAADLCRRILQICGSFSAFFGAVATEFCSNMELQQQICGSFSNKFVNLVDGCVEML
ncbi:hypothetical protein Patl1_19796 [Pistacia atlantica]|uniref:Uncharacterized protein n=1 Tax=Pistacia atlantica TaxID=434234 RepID=A0ACC1BNI0_9ROSI|nr:hypothetical protein Patl1_19796 [Pistacia atlantica]